MTYKQNYAVAPMSLAHTFGNMTAFVTEYIKGMFPKDYFKTVNIASSIAYRHFSVFDSRNKNFIKKNKPMLIVRPRVDIMNNDVFLNGTLLTTRITDNFYDRDFGNLQPFIEDNKRGIYVKYLANRIKMYFDITFIFETQIEQLNQAMYLKNRVRHEIPFVIQTHLENNVPREIMQGVAKDAGIDINDTKTFLDYVNKHSYYPVTYKLKNSTGLDEYFRYYPAYIDAIFTGFTIEDGSKKGFVDDAYPMSITLETEFFTSGIYFFFTKNPETITDFSLSISTEDGQSIIPIYTMPAVSNIEPPEGWELYANTLYKVETSAQPDHLDFSSLINKSLKSAIDYHLKNSIPLNPLIKIFVYKDSELLDINKGDFEVDYSTLTLITNKVNTTSTYRLLIYVNIYYINNLISNILRINEEK
jgi:hypothetical protein